jgi:hypothetical protein
MIIDDRPRGELIQSFRQQILERHEAGQKADSDLREVILRKIELTRQCGHVLADAKGTLKEREFAEATDFLSNDAVKNYLKFARSNPEPVTELAQAIAAIEAALTLTGTLPFPAGHGFQNIHSPNFFSVATMLIQRLAADWAKFQRASPLSEWRTEQIENFQATLTPILRIFKTLNVELSKRQ